MLEYVLVLCNGEPPSRSLALAVAGRASLVVAADGGANIARRFGIRPDIIVGDFDSITPAAKTFFSTSRRRSTITGRGSTAFVYVSRQDNTDLEKALDLVRDEGARKVVLLAATGKRIDHTLGNLSVLWNYSRKLDITLAGEGWTALPVEKRKRVRVRRGTTVSLVPFGMCSGITLRGLRFPLTNATMKVGQIGVSNVVAKSPFTVSVRRGRMLMIVHAPLFSLSVLS